MIFRKENRTLGDSRFAFRKEVLGILGFWVRVVQPYVPRRELDPHSRQKQLNKSIIECWWKISEEHSGRELLSDPTNHSGCPVQRGSPGHWGNPRPTSQSLYRIWFRTDGMKTYFEDFKHFVHHDRMKTEVLRSNFGVKFNHWNTLPPAVNREIEERTSLESFRRISRNQHIILIHHRVSHQHGPCADERVLLSLANNCLSIRIM